MRARLVDGGGAARRGGVGDIVGALVVADSQCLFDGGAGAGELQLVSLGGQHVQPLQQPVGGDRALLVEFIFEQFCLLAKAGARHTGPTPVIDDAFVIQMAGAMQPKNTTLASFFGHNGANISQNSGKYNLGV